MYSWYNMLTVTSHSGLAIECPLQRVFVKTSLPTYRYFA